jgi:putative ABC transport system permease protein
MRSVLVTGQLALSTALLIGALLMAKSYFALQNVERGYRTDGILTAELSLSGEGLDEGEQKIAAVERLVDRLAQVPRVEGVGVSSQLPTSQSNRVWGLVAQGRPVEPGEYVDATMHAIAGDYLATLQIPVVAGRAFNPLEIRQGGKVALVSQGLAQRLWGEENVIGRRLGGPQSTDEDWYTVVGVVGDVDYGRDMVSFGDLPEVQFYLPYGELPTSRAAVVVGSSLPPETLAPAIRDSFRTSIPGVPFSEILTMEDAIFRVRWVSALFGRQLAMYAIMATIIAALGLYGLTAESVSRRTRELAIRSALGADRLTLVRLIIRESMTLGGLGILLGVVLAFGVTRFGSQMLLMVNARDPMIFTGVTVLLLAITLFAAFLPARRASLLDTNSALRME